MRVAGGKNLAMENPSASAMASAVASVGWLTFVSSLLIWLPASWTRSPSSAWVKFLFWCSCGRSEAEYPNYVVAGTHCSPDRAEPLQRDICVSDNHAQIEQLWDEPVKEQIVQGWTLG